MWSTKNWRFIVFLMVRNNCGGWWCSGQTPIEGIAKSAGPKDHRRKNSKTVVGRQIHAWICPFCFPWLKMSEFVLFPSSILIPKSWEDIGRLDLWYQTQSCTCNLKMVAPWRFRRFRIWKPILFRFQPLNLGEGVSIHGEWIGIPCLKWSHREFTPWKFQ